MSEWPIGYDPDDFKKLAIPRISDAALREIGRFMILWGITEAQLDAIVTAVYGLDHTYSLTITAGMNNKAKIEVLRSSLDQLREPLGASFVEHADYLLVEVAKLSGGVRNVIAHGQLTVSLEGHRKSVDLIRINARKQLQIISYPTTVKVWKSQCSHLKFVAQELRRLVPHIVETVKHLSPADYERLCVTR